MSIKRIVRKILGRPKAASFFMADNASYEEYEIGAGTYGYPEVLTWREGSTLRIGSYCSISARVVIMLGGEHNIGWVSTYPFSKLFPGAEALPVNSRTKGDVSIGSDVWIGEGVCILSGVSIGHGAVVAARSVVTKDVQPYSIVGGNPAKHIRFRFDEPTRRALQEIAWWEWPEERIREALPMILSSDIDMFIERYGVARKSLASR